MNLRSRMRSWLRTLFRRSRLESEMDEELRFHIAAYAEDLVRGGVEREEALRRARIEFGGVERAKEECRDARGISFVEGIFQDLRFGLRMLRKSPGFTAIAILTLALGIGANTAIFSLIDAVILRTLPVPRPQQLVALGWAARSIPTVHSQYGYATCPFRSTGSAPETCSVSSPLFDQLSREQTSFSGLFSFVPPEPVDATIEGKPTTVNRALVSGGFFSTLEVRPAVGRVLGPADDAAGAAPIAVLSYRFWQDRFGGNRSVVGKTIVMNKVAFAIVGVASRGFIGIEPGLNTDVWIPLTARGANSGFPMQMQNDARSLWLQVVGRLKPEISMARARRATNPIFVRDVTSGSDAPFKPSAKPRLLLASFANGADTLRGAFSQVLVLLLIVTGIVLLLACTNVAGLALARSVARQKEIALRLALGTTRGRLIRQLLTESLLLAAAGGAAGILLAYWGASSLLAFLSANPFFPIQLDVHPDLRVLVFLVLVSALVGVLAGISPAIRATSVNLTSALKESSSAQACEKRPWHRLRLGSVLVVAQVALSILVLAAAGLLVRSLLNRETGHAGFRTGNILTFDLYPKSAAARGSQFVAEFEQLQNRLRALPGVISATYSSRPPMRGGHGMYSYRIAGEPSRPGTGHMTAELAVGSEFFETFGIPIVAGRGFTATDFRSSAKPHPVIVNREFVKQAFGTKNPLGGEIVDFGDAPAQIVDVVPDVSYDSPPDGKAPLPRLYYPFRGSFASFEVRTSGDPKALIPVVRQIVSRADGDLVLTDATTVAERIAKLLFLERLIGWLSSLFALLALLLACIGLYGLLAWEVARRTHEIGIRMALGAERQSVLRIVLLRGAGLAIVGTVAGLGLAFGLTRLLQHFLFGVSATDPASFAGVACLLLLTALAACYFPARRAMKVDSTVALRHE